MFTNIFIYIALAVGVLLLWNYGKIKQSVFLVSVVLLAVLIVAVPIVASHNSVVGDADTVAVYADARICYDEFNDEYFLVEQTMWHPIEHFVRYEINQDEAVELVGAYETAKKIPHTNILPES